MKNDSTDHVEDSGHYQRAAVRSSQTVPATNATTVPERVVTTTRTTGTLNVRVTTRPVHTKQSTDK
jgi:hypothetical protein